MSPTMTLIKKDWHVSLAFYWSDCSESDHFDGHDRNSDNDACKCLRWWWWWGGGSVWENEPCSLRAPIFSKSPPFLVHWTHCTLIHWWAEQISTKNLSLSASTARHISKDLNLSSHFPYRQLSLSSTSYALFHPAKHSMVSGNDTERIIRYMRYHNTVISHIYTLSSRFLQIHILSLPKIRNL